MSEMMDDEMFHMSQGALDGSLIDAIIADQAGEALAYLGQGADPFAQRNGHSAFWFVVRGDAERGAYGVLEAMIQAAIDSDDAGRRVDHGESLACLAAECELPGALRALLQAGVSPDEMGSEDFTLAQKAAHAGSAQCLAALIEAGVDLEAKAERSGRSALHQACAGGWPECVEMLARAGADIESKDEDGATPLARACARGMPQSVEALLAAGARPNAERPDDGHSPLGAAAAGGYLKIVQMLIQAGAELNQRSRHGATPMFAACDAFEPVDPGRLAGVVRALLEAGADHAVLDASGKTAKDRAANKGRSECVAVIERFELAADQRPEPPEKSMRRATL